MKPGAVVAGFEVVRVISRDADGLVCEARQPGLDRIVILRVLSKAAADRESRQRFDDAVQKLASLESSALPSLIAADFSSAPGPFGAFRPREGVPLATSPGGRARRLRALADVADSLDRLHEAGLAHGAMDADAVRVDSGGRGALLHAGLGGVAHEESEAVNRDRLAFGRLLSDVGGSRAYTRLAPLLEGSKPASAGELYAGVVPLARPSASRRVAVAIGALVAVAVAVTLVLATGGDGPAEDPATQLPASATSIGCEGDPEPNSVECTLAQISLDGADAAVRKAGAIRSWAVKGAEGELALQVIRKTPAGWRTVRSSQVESPETFARQEFPTDLAVHRGDYLALELFSGSSVAIEADPTAKTLRWSDALRWEVRSPVKPQLQEHRGRLLFSARVVPGAHQRQPPQVFGEEAAQATDGEVLGERAVVAVGGKPRLVEVVRSEDQVFIDLLQGQRRIARMTLPLALAEGELGPIGQWDGRTNGFVLDWINGDDDYLRHGVLVRPDRLVLVN